MIVRLNTVEKPIDDTTSGTAEIIKLRTNRRVLPSDPVQNITSHKADPITSEDDIDRMIDVCICRNKIRDAVLLSFGCNLGLRISDIVALRYKDIFDDQWRVRDMIVIKEQKTGNIRKLFPNQSVVLAAKIMLHAQKQAGKSVNQDDYIFTSESPHKAYVDGHVKCIAPSTAFRMIKSASMEAGVLGNISTHSMRKSFGHFVTEKMPDKMAKTGSSVMLVQRIFNHSTPAITMRYIGLSDRDEIEAYASLNLGLNPLKKYAEKVGV